MKVDGIAPEVAEEFERRADQLRDEYEDAACVAEALRCLECGFKRGSHAPDCEDGRQRPGMILVSSALVLPENRFRE